jgi:hypothetical protein
MNEQLANTIRSQLSGGESYDHFSPSNHQLVNKAFTIQNLLEVSKGNASQMAKLVEAPDLKNFYYSDLTPEQIDITKQLWGL